MHISLLQDLEQLLGPAGITLNPDLDPVGNWRNYPYQSTVLVRPQSTAEVAQVMALCHQAQTPVVVYGGGSGLVGATATSPQDITLSLERMNTIEDINTIERTMTVQAGTVLQTIQEAAASENLFFALDLGARGSATIGGNISTNAGGNQVIRYGMVREQILGLEVVLADGTILSSMNHMLKNNAGYDLKHLFIGSEGTLGVVTRAVLRLRPAMPARNTAFVATDSFAKLPLLLSHMETALGGKLSAFEAIWNNYYVLASKGPHLGTPPFPPQHAFYALIESTGNDEAQESEEFLNALEEALSEDLIVDAVLAKSETEREALWAIRDNIDCLSALDPIAIFDVSLPIGEMENYLQELEHNLEQQLGITDLATFGHLGDGNLHIIVGVGRDDPERYHQVEELLYQPLQLCGGSISAEHGIGLEKKPYLRYSRSAEEIDAMRRLKQAFDPRNILNPGKIF